MALVSSGRFAELLAPYLSQAEITPDLLTHLSAYLDLLVHWNARTNLTAVRGPETMVQRQIGESLFAAQCLPAGSRVLDFGSGAGFPGIPLHLLRPDLQMTLAESQGKKAGFLREAVRQLGLRCEVWPRRVEAMAPERRFDVVVMRAVDDSTAMVPVALARVARGGSLLRYVPGTEESVPEAVRVEAAYALPLSPGKLVRLAWSHPAERRGT